METSKPEKYLAIFHKLFQNIGIIAQSARSPNTGYNTMLIFFFHFNKEEGLCG